MSIETNGTTNGAPQGNKNLKTTILAGDFLKLLAHEQNQSEISNLSFEALKNSENALVIGLEPNNNKDLVFLEFLENNPDMVNVRKTKEEWEKLLSNYLNNKNGMSEIDINQ